MYHSFLPFIYGIIGFFLLIYFWVPLFIFLFVGMCIFIIVNYIIAKVSGKPSNFNMRIIRFRPNQSSNQEDNIDYIDSTTADKENK